MITATAARRRGRRHADPGRHRGPDRAETLALLFLAAVLVVAALAVALTLPFWMAAT